VARSCEVSRGRRRSEFTTRARTRHGAQQILADGHGASRVLHERSSRRSVIDSHLDIRDPRATSSRATDGSSRWATVASTSASDCSRPAARGRASTPPNSGVLRLTNRDAWGLNDETCCGPATGGRLPMGLALGPRSGPIRSRSVTRRNGQPVQRRRHRLRLRDRAHRGRRRRRGAARQRLVATGLYDERLESATATTSRSRERSFGSSRNRRSSRPVSASVYESSH